MVVKGWAAAVHTSAGGNVRWLWKPVCHYLESKGCADCMKQQYCSYIANNSSKLGIIQMTISKRTDK